MIPVDRAQVEREYERALEIYSRCGPENVVTGSAAKARAKAFEEILDGEFNVEPVPEEDRYHEESTDPPITATSARALHGGREA